MVPVRGWPRSASKTKGRFRPLLNGLDVLCASALIRNLTWGQPIVPNRAAGLRPAHCRSSLTPRSIGIQLRAVNRPPNCQRTGPVSPEGYCSVSMGLLAVPRSMIVALVGGAHVKIQSKSSKCIGLVLYKSRNALRSRGNKYHMAGQSRRCICIIV